MTNNKRFKERANICQRKSEYYTEILIFLKLPLPHMQLWSDVTCDKTCVCKSSYMSRFDL